jgi:hypothetical protein
MLQPPVAWEFSLNEGQVGIDGIENLEHGVSPLAPVRFERAFRLPADHAGKATSSTLRTEACRLSETRGMPVSNRDRKRKFAIPGTGPDRGRNPAVTGAVIGKMAGGWLGEFHLCLVSRVSRHGL